MADRFQLPPDQRKAHDQREAQMRIDIQTTALRCEHWQSCLNCDHFTEGVSNDKRKMQPAQPMFCTLFKATPPAIVIVNGCTDWQMDIPF